MGVGVGRVGVTAEMGRQRCGVLSTISRSVEKEQVRVGAVESRFFVVSSWWGGCYLRMLKYILDARFQET